MRGSGPAGLAGIGLLTPFAAGWLVRPLIDVSRGALEAYAAARDLRWVEDPANEDLRFDRNYLRHEILPRLEARWPDAAGRIRRSAALAREATTLLLDLAEIDRQRCADRMDRLLISELRALSVERQRNLLRHVILELGLPAPGRTWSPQAPSRIRISGRIQRRFLQPKQRA